MAAKGTKLPVIVTPKGVAAYAWLNKKDTKFDKEGVYKITVLLPKKDMPEGRLDGGKTVVPGKDWIKHILSECKAHGVPDKIGTTGCPVKDGDKMDKEDFHGFLMITAKTTFDPKEKIVDTKGNQLPGRTTVFSGDVVKVGIQPVIREVKGDKFMSMYIAKVMLIEKNAGADVDFGEEEGYTVSDADKAADVDFGTEDDAEGDDGNGDF